MFTLPDLPYEFKALDPYLDERTMQLHHDFHHATYVKNLNDALSGYDNLLEMDINELIQNLDKVPEAVRTKVRNNGGGHANHSMFWTNMSPNGGGEPGGKLGEAIQNDFGDFKKFKTDLSEIAKNRFGSGWAWMYVDNDKKLKIIDTPNQDTPMMEGKIPVLGIDVWEHAYYLKYQNRRIDYIEAFWSVINWEDVTERYEKALA